MSSEHWEAPFANKRPPEKMTSLNIVPQQMENRALKLQESFRPKSNLV